MYTNRPFQKEKKIQIVKTEFGGWGVEAAEYINQGDFVIEYIGEVIDDAMCEQRLWDMKHRGVQNFYMCEIGKDFTIDATFKDLASARMICYLHSLESLLYPYGLSNAHE